jgi:hypothetical protein
MSEYSVGGTRTTNLDRLARYVSPVRWENIWTSTTVTPYFNVTRPRNCFFMTGRSNNADTGIPGYPVIGWNANDKAAYFPDDATAVTAATNATVNLPACLDATAAPVGCVSHQGRAVLFPLKFYGHGLNATNATNEQFFWSSVNDWRTRDPVFTATGPPSYQAASVSYDDTGGGFQLWASMTANELLLGKARGGAVVVRGGQRRRRRRRLRPRRLGRRRRQRQRAWGQGGQGDARQARVDGAGQGRGGRQGQGQGQGQGRGGGREGEEVWEGRRRAARPGRVPAPHEEGNAGRDQGPGPGLVGGGEDDPRGGGWRPGRSVCLRPAFAVCV